MPFLLARLLVFTARTSGGCRDAAGNRTRRIRRHARPCRGRGARQRPTATSRRSTPSMSLSGWVWRSPTTIGNRRGRESFRCGRSAKRRRTIRFCCAPIRGPNDCNGPWPTKSASTMPSRFLRHSASIRAKPIPSRPRNGGQSSGRPDAVADRLVRPDAAELRLGSARSKQRYATASHELIARRMLDFEPWIVITIFDNGRLTFRRSNRFRPPARIHDRRAANAGGKSPHRAARAGSKDAAAHLGLAGLRARLAARNSADLVRRSSARRSGVWRPGRRSAGFRRARARRAIDCAAYYAVRLFLREHFSCQSRSASKNGLDNTAATPAALARSISSGRGKPNIATIGAPPPACFRRSTPSARVAAIGLGIPQQCAWLRIRRSRAARATPRLVAQRRGKRRPVRRPLRPLRPAPRSHASSSGRLDREATQRANRSISASSCSSAVAVAGKFQTRRFPAAKAANCRAPRCGHWCANSPRPGPGPAAAGLSFAPTAEQPADSRQRRRPPQPHHSR